MVWVGQSDEPPDLPGGKLVQITTSGLVNALAAHPGGIVNSKLVNILTEKEMPLPTAGNLTYSQVRPYALALHRVVQTKTEADFLATTPSRIKEMLCSELEATEFRSIKRRIHETVMEGKGRNNGDENPDDIPVAARVVEHDIEKEKKCRVCGNTDQGAFTLDRKNGDIICKVCGTVFMESLMHEGSQFRKFEGESDRNHHGDAPNKLFSNAHNMATTLGGVQFTSSAGGPGFGSQKQGIETMLRNTNTFVKLNISNMATGNNNKERRTRIGYKDGQKKEAFVQMTHVGDALHLHDAVVQRGKELFAGFRDNRELVQSFKGVLAACLVLAFEQLSNEGLQIMRARQQQDAAQLLNSRANRRNELHNVSLAGKGGLLLDFSKIESKEKTTATSSLDAKPASTWDLDDCRSWLLESSRSISQRWMEDRKVGKRVPEGTEEELEGKLVEHTMTLCDQLEVELKAKNKVGLHNRNKIKTPRVRDMAHLGIKWQHSHERGSGGKGGVGGSGRAVTGIKPGEHAGRTAGQILILKTAKKLGLILKDPISGQAFHQELRALVGRQDARKIKDQREAAARQRFQQMKRKPWLQARAEISS